MSNIFQFLIKITVKITFKIALFDRDNTIFDQKRCEKFATLSKIAVYRLNFQCIFEKIQNLIENSFLVKNTIFETIIFVHNFGVTSDQKIIVFDVEISWPKIVKN